MKRIRLTLLVLSIIFLNIAFSSFDGHYLAKEDQSINELETPIFNNSELRWLFLYGGISSFSILCFNSSKTLVKGNICTNYLSSPFPAKLKNQCLSNYSNLTSHPPINIQSDEDFTSLGLNNSGNIDDPFIIENLYINVTSENEIGINVKNTLKFFVIRNCLIESYNSSIIINNIADNSAYIFNNTLIHKSNLNPSAGIHYNASDGSIIEKNACKNFQYGIKAEIAIDTVIKENKCLGSKYGIFTNYCCNLSIINNQCSRGISFSTSNPAGILLSESPESIIEQNTCSYNKMGISIYNSNHTIIRKNNCFHNTFYSCCSSIFYQDAGISICVSHNCSIEENNSYSNFKGIGIMGTSNSNISKNLVRDNSDGIAALSIANSKIYNNTIENNVMGIDISSWSHMLTEFNVIEHNVIKNGGYGLFLWGCYNSQIKSNEISNNKGYGAYLNINNEDNEIYHNYFTNNSYKREEESKQACDKGERNFWYNKEIKEGNYWDDLEELVYRIDGSANSVDLYPLNSPLREITTEPFLLTVSCLICLCTLITRKKRKKTDELTNP